MINTIFFDFDGVIVESVDIKTQAFAKLFQHEGHEIVSKVVDYHTHNTGVSRYDKFKYFYREFLKRPLSEEEFEQLCNRFASIVVDEVINSPYVPGAIEFLKRYAGTYKYFIVSATPHAEIEIITRKRGIADLFKGIFGSPAKKSDIVKKILIEENIRAAHAAYVGDAMSDYRAAAENGLYFIARTTAGSTLFHSIECIKIKDLSALDEAISAVGNNGVTLAF